MKYRCKCSNRHCRKRRTLAKHPDDYKRPPKCECGQRRWAIDLHRQLKKPGWNAPGCDCDRLPRRHRHNNKGCMHYENYVLEAAMRDTKARFKNTDTDCPF